MAEQQYDNNGNPIKKPFTIKVAGFTLGKKFFIVTGILVTIIVLSCINSSVQRKKEEEKAALAAAEAAAAAENSKTTQEVVTFDAHVAIQESLTETYGIAPDGFEWNYDGSLVPLSDDDEATSEDVVYMFVRALSILDFSTAEKYSSDSNVINSYQSYYSNISEDLINYYDKFLRKQFKKSLTSIEIENITDTAVFADGTEYVTLNISVLDLTDKDFWRDDEDALWQQLRVYEETEEDDVKLQQYVYDYIYEKYEDGSIGKKTYTIELIVTKQNGGGWLVSGDGELDAILEYENGVDVAQYILDAFSTWYQETTLQEQIEDMQREVDAMTSELNTVYDAADSTAMED